jgi:hypothetical protein
MRAKFSSTFLRTVFVVAQVEELPSQVPFLKEK